MADGDITPELVRLGDDMFSRMNFSPEFSTIVSGCLRRGRNGDGVEVVVNTTRGAFSLTAEDQELIRDSVESGAARDVCITIRNALCRELRIEEI